MGGGGIDLKKGAWRIEGHRSERWYAWEEIVRWREGTREGMRGREGGLGIKKVDVVCLLSFRPELYLVLQTGSSVPERPDDPA